MSYCLWSYRYLTLLVSGDWYFSVYVAIFIGRLIMLAHQTVELLKNTDFALSTQPFECEPLRMCLWNQLLNCIDTHLSHLHFFTITNSEHLFYTCAV